MFLIIGLGNPGQKYQDTRHNVGFKLIDCLAQTLNVVVDKRRYQSLIQETFWQGKKILLVQPQTYMNLSGQAVSEIINYYHDQIEDLLIIHDDLDLPLGQLRFKKGGGTGGHNGLKSIIKHLNSADFDRLKIGIGHPLGTAKEVHDYVLSGFGSKEKQILQDTLDIAVQAVKAWLENGLDEAMNEYNQKRS